MAKQLMGNGANGYAFDASAKTVTFSGIDLEPHQILLINNVSRETIIYNPFSSGKGFSSFANGVLTLEFDTSSHDDADVLQIFYDNSDMALSKVEELGVSVNALVAQIADPPWHNKTGGIVIGSGALSTITTVSTVTTVSNITSLGSMSVTFALTDRLDAIAFQLIRDRLS